MIIDGVDREAEPLPDDYRAHFAGRARFQQLTSPFEGGPDVFIVHFDAGGRTRPHVHHRGQILHIVSGEGVVADRDGRHVVSPGDTVTVSPDEWHWHGALPHSPMSHLSVQHRGTDVSWDVEAGDWADGYDG
jgi:quercetin dioxygenase-like cupin family protein